MPGTELITLIQTNGEVVLKKIPTSIQNYLLLQLFFELSVCDL